jgi:hypothetical protein
VRYFESTGNFSFWVWDGSRAWWEFTDRTRSPQTSRYLITDAPGFVHAGIWKEIPYLPWMDQDMIMDEGL